MFVVAEVHPFGDGNGRTARLAMNLALTIEGRTRIIIPTVMREDYIQSLKRLTHHGEPDAYVRVLNVAAEFSRKLHFQTFEELRESLLVSNAMKGPDEAILRLAALPEG
jgi:Fic family protein